MDYLLLNTLMATLIAIILISYDIACQYQKNFKKRMMTYPEDLHLDLDNTLLRWAIPKKHILVHGEDHAQYYLNYLESVGRTYGEGIESGELPFVWHTFLLTQDNRVEFNEFSLWCHSGAILWRPS